MSMTMDDSIKRWTNSDGEAQPADAPAFVLLRCFQSVCQISFRRSLLCQWDNAAWPQTNTI